VSNGADSTDTLIKHHVTYCDVESHIELSYPVRYMNEQEWRERDKLRIENTSEKLRARVVAHHAHSNGHSRYNIFDD